MSKMLIKYHFLFGLIISLLLYPVYGINVLIIFFTNILLDVDHYILYIFKFRSFNMLKANKYFINHVGTSFLFLHTAEFVILLLIFSLYSDFAFFILIGVALHLLLDIRDEFRFSHIGRFPSVLWYLILKKRNK